MRRSRWRGDLSTHGNPVTTTSNHSLLAGRDKVAHTLNLSATEWITMMGQRQRNLTYLCMTLSRCFRVCVARGARNNRPWLSNFSPSNPSNLSSQDHPG